MVIAPTFGARSVIAAEWTAQDVDVDVAVDVRPAGE